MCYRSYQIPTIWTKRRRIILSSPIFFITIGTYVLFHSTSFSLKDIMIHDINKSWIEKTLIGGFKKLRVWQDTVSLYILACKVFTDFPFELKKVAANCIDASHSISRNISEGYCRRSLKEYLNHLNIALGSCGEFHSCYVSFKKAGQISDDKYTSRKFYNLVRTKGFFRGLSSCLGHGIMEYWNIDSKRK